MARFQFFLVGTSQSPVVEVGYKDLRELHEAIEHSRFLHGQLVEIEGHSIELGVIIPMNRIHMISEIEI